MAVQDNLDYLLYVSKGGKLSFTEWMNAGKPPASGGTPGTPVTPSTPPSPSVSATVTAPQPSPPTYNAPPPGADVGDTTDQDIQDAIAYDKYQKNGGQMSYEGWKGNGRPISDTQTPLTGGGDFTNPTALPSIPPPPGHKWAWDGFRWQPKEIEEDSNVVDPELGNAKQMPVTPPPKGFHWEWRGDRWHPVKDEPTAVEPERKKKSRQPGAPDKYFDAYGREWTWDDYEGYQETGYDKTKDTRLTEKDKGATQPTGEVPTDRFGRKATWDADDGEWRYPPDWNVDPAAAAKSAAERAAKEAEDRRRWETEQKRQFEDAAFRQQQSQQQAQQSSDQFWAQFDRQAAQEAARLKAEKEARLANLRASPASWLQYSLEANQTPVIQPWQKPLMPQQYGNLNVGQPIPGWAGLNQGSSNLPELTTPSTQYFARIGPTAQQQWGGYQQMQSGAPIDESMFRLQSQSAPGGRNRGLSWLR